MAEDKGKPEAKEPKNDTPPPPRPVRLQVISSGQQGQYTFYIQAMSDQGRGIKAKVLVIEGTHKRSVNETDENGFIEGYKAQPFKDEEQEFSFSVIGSDLREEVTLDGPEQPKPPPRKKIKPIAGGFWANFKHAIAENRKNKGN